MFKVFLSLSTFLSSYFYVQDSLCRFSAEKTTKCHPHFTSNRKGRWLVPQIWIVALHWHRLCRYLGFLLTRLRKLDSEFDRRIRYNIAPGEAVKAGWLIGWPHDLVIDRGVRATQPRTVVIRRPCHQPILVGRIYPMVHMEILKNDMSIIGKLIQQRWGSMYAPTESM